MLKELIKLANELDTKGLQKEADALDKIISVASGCGSRESLSGPEGKEVKDYERPEDQSRIGSMTEDLLDYIASDDSTEDAWDFIKNLFSKKSSDKNKVIKTAGGLSSWQMLEDEEQRDEELKISALILKEAKRRSGREDISKEMLSEFLEDIKSDVKRMVKDLTESMNSFNMEPFEEEDSKEEEPTEHRYNPNKPWDALFPPKQ